MVAQKTSQKVLDKAMNGKHHKIADFILNSIEDKKLSSKVRDINNKQDLLRVLENNCVKKCFYEKIFDLFRK